jgi:hypothetical protein
MKDEDLSPEFLIATHRYYLPHRLTDYDGDVFIFCEHFNTVVSFFFTELF